MSEENKPSNEIDETKDSEEVDEKNEPDYKALYESTKAESRKWERQSKKNFEKAKKYDELVAGDKSVEDRIAALEADKKRLEDEKARAKLVKSVSSETGVPESIVASLSATDEETMTAQAKAIAENYKTPGGAPKAPEAGKFPKGDGGAADEKRQFVRQLLGK